MSGGILDCFKTQQVAPYHGKSFYQSLSQNDSLADVESQASTYAGLEDAQYASTHGSWSGFSDSQDHNPKVIKGSFSWKIQRHINEPVRDKASVEALFESKVSEDAELPFGKTVQEHDQSIEGEWVYKDGETNRVATVSKIEGTLFLSIVLVATAELMPLQIEKDRSFTATFNSHIVRMRFGFKKDTQGIWLLFTNNRSDAQLKSDSFATRKQTGSNPLNDRRVVRKVATQAGAVAILYDRPMTKQDNQIPLTHSLTKRGKMTGESRDADKMSMASQNSFLPWLYTRTEKLEEFMARFTVPLNGYLKCRPDAVRTHVLTIEDSQWFLGSGKWWHEVSDESDIGWEKPRSEFFHMGGSTFTIHIDQTDGIEPGIDCDRTGDALKINRVYGGHFAAWNEKNPKQKVLPGDILFEANGASGDWDKMIGELMKKHPVTIKLYRETVASQGEATSSLTYWKGIPVADKTWRWEGERVTCELGLEKDKSMTFTPSGPFGRLNVSTDSGITDLFHVYSQNILFVLADPETAMSNFVEQVNSYKSNFETWFNEGTRSKQFDAKVERCKGFLQGQIKDNQPKKATDIRRIGSYRWILFDGVSDRFVPDFLVKNVSSISVEDVAVEHDGTLVLRKNFPSIGGATLVDVARDIDDPEVVEEEKKKTDQEETQPSLSQYLTQGRRILEIKETKDGKTLGTLGQRGDSASLMAAWKAPNASIRVTVESNLTDRIDQLLYPRQKSQLELSVGDTFVLQSKCDCAFTGLAIQGAITSKPCSIEITILSDPAGKKGEPYKIDAQQLDDKDAGEDNDLFLFPFIKKELDTSQKRIKDSRLLFIGTQLQIKIKTGRIQATGLAIWGAKGKDEQTFEKDFLFGNDDQLEYRHKYSRIKELMSFIGPVDELKKAIPEVRCINVMTFQGEQSRMFHAHSHYWLERMDDYFDPKTKPEQLDHVSTGEEPWKQIINFHFRDIAVSPDGYFLAAITHQKFVVWDLKPGPTTGQVIDAHTLKQLAIVSRDKEDKVSAKKPLRKLKTLCWRQINGACLPSLIIGCTNGEVLVYEQSGAEKTFWLCCIIEDVMVENNVGIPITSMQMTWDNNTVVCAGVSNFGTSSQAMHCLFWSYSEVKRMHKNSNAKSALHDAKVIAETSWELDSMKLDKIGLDMQKADLDEVSNTKVDWCINCLPEMRTVVRQHSEIKGKIKTKEKDLQDALSQDDRLNGYAFNEKASDRRFDFEPDSVVKRIVHMQVLNNYQMGTLCVVAKEGKSMLRFYVWSLDIVALRGRGPQYGWNLKHPCSNNLDLLCKFASSISMCLVTSRPAMLIAHPLHGLAYCELQQDTARVLDLEADWIPWSNWLQNACFGKMMVLLSSGKWSSTMCRDRNPLPLAVHINDGGEEDAYGEIDITEGVTPEVLVARLPNMRQEANGGKCDSGRHDCVLWDDQPGSYTTFICNSCRQSKSGNRWWCPPCRDDYCFDCRPLVKVSSKELEDEQIEHHQVGIYKVNQLELLKGGSSRTNFEYSKFQLDTRKFSGNVTSINVLEKSQRERANAQTQFFVKADGKEHDQDEIGIHPVPPVQIRQILPPNYELLLSEWRSAEEVSAPKDDGTTGLEERKEPPEFFITHNVSEPALTARGRMKKYSTQSALECQNKNGDFQNTVTRKDSASDGFFVAVRPQEDNNFNFKPDKGALPISFKVFIEQEKGKTVSEKDKEDAICEFDVGFTLAKGNGVDFDHFSECRLVTIGTMPSTQTDGTMLRQNLQRYRETGNQLAEAEAIFAGVWHFNRGMAAKEPDDSRGTKAYTSFVVLKGKRSKPRLDWRPQTGDTKMITLMLVDKPKVGEEDEASGYDLQIFISEAQKWTEVNSPNVEPEKDKNALFVASLVKAEDEAGKEEEIKAKAKIADEYLVHPWESLIWYTKRQSVYKKINQGVVTKFRPGSYNEIEGIQYKELGEEGATKTVRTEGHERIWNGGIKLVQQKQPKVTVESDDLLSQFQVPTPYGVVQGLRVEPKIQYLALSDYGDNWLTVELQGLDKIDKEEQKKNSWYVSLTRNYHDPFNDPKIPKSSDLKMGEDKETVTIPVKGDIDVGLYTLRLIKGAPRANGDAVQTADDTLLGKAETGEAPSSGDAATLYWASDAKIFVYKPNNVSCIDSTILIGMEVVASDMSKAASEQQGLIYARAWACELPQLTRPLAMHCSEKGVCLLGDWIWAKKPGCVFIPKLDKNDDRMGKRFTWFNTIRRLACATHKIESGQDEHIKGLLRVPVLKKDGKSDDMDLWVTEVDDSGFNARWAIKKFSPENETALLLMMWNLETPYVFIFQVPTTGKKPQRMFCLTLHCQTYEILTTSHGFVYSSDYRLFYVDAERHKEIVEKVKAVKDKGDTKFTCKPGVKCFGYNEEQINRGMYWVKMDTRIRMKHNEPTKAEGESLDSDYCTSMIEVGKDFICCYFDFSYAAQFFQFDSEANRYVVFGKNPERSRIVIPYLAQCYKPEGDTSPEKLRTRNEVHVFKWSRENLNSAVVHFSKRRMCITTNQACYFMRRPEINEIFYSTKGGQDVARACIGMTYPIVASVVGGQENGGLQVNFQWNSLRGSLQISKSTNSEKGAKQGRGGEETGGDSETRSDQQKVKMLGIHEPPDNDSDISPSIFVVVHLDTGGEIRKYDLQPSESRSASSEYEVVASWSTGLFTTLTDKWDTILVSPNTEATYLVTYSTSTKEVEAKLWNTTRRNDNLGWTGQDKLSLGSAQFMKVTCACFAKYQTVDKKQMLVLCSEDRVVVVNCSSTEKKEGAILYDLRVGKETGLNLLPNEEIRGILSGQDPKTDGSSSDHVVLKTNCQRLIYQSLISPLNFAFSPDWLMDQPVDKGTKDKAPEDTLSDQQGLQLHWCRKSKCTIDQENMKVTYEGRATVSLMEFSKKAGADKGKWYYEVLFTTQPTDEDLVWIGWAETAKMKEMNKDENSPLHVGAAGTSSYSVEVINQTKWPNGPSPPDDSKYDLRGQSNIDEGTRIGCGLDLDAKTIQWYFNGQPASSNMRITSTEMCPMISADPMSGLQICCFAEGALNNGVKHLPPGYHVLQDSQSRKVPAISDKIFFSYNLQSAKLCSCLEIPNNAFKASSFMESFVDAEDPEGTKNMNGMGDSRPYCARILPNNENHDRWWRPDLRQLSKKEFHSHGQWIEVDLGTDFWVCGFQVQGLKALRITKMTLRLQPEDKEAKALEYQLEDLAGGDEKKETTTYQDEEDETGEMETKNEADKQQLHNAYFKFSAGAARYIRLTINQQKADQDMDAPLGVRMEVYYRPPKLECFHAGRNAGTYNIYYRNHESRAASQDIRLDMITVGVASKMRVEDLLRAYKYQTKERTEMEQQLAADFKKFQIIRCALYVADQRQNLTQVQWNKAIREGADSLFANATSSTSGEEEKRKEAEKKKQIDANTDRLVSRAKSMRACNSQQMVFGIGFGPSYRSLLHELSSDAEGKKETFLNWVLNEGKKNTQAAVDEEQDISNISRALTPAHFLVRCAIEPDQDDLPCHMPSYRPLEVIMSMVDEIKKVKHKTQSTKAAMTNMSSIATTMLQKILDQFRSVGEEGWWHVARLLKDLPVEVIIKLNMESFILANKVDHQDQQSIKGDYLRMETLSEMRTESLEPYRKLSGKGRALLLIAIPTVLGDPANLKDSLLHRVTHKNAIEHANRVEFQNDLKTFCQTTLVKHVIDHKWESYGKKIFRVEFGAYIIYLVLFMYVSLQLARMENYTSINEVNCVYPLLGVLSIHGLVELHKMNESGLRDYFSGEDLPFHVVSLFNMGSVIFSLWSLWNKNLKEVDPKERSVSMSVLSVTALTFWFYLVKFLLGLELTGTFIRVLLQLFWEIGAFMLCLLVTLVGFAHGFFIFYHRKAEGVLDDDPHDRFDTFSHAFITVYQMVLGDYPFEDLEHHWLSLTYFVMFSFFITITLLNVLIATMNHSYTKATERAKSQYILARATLVAKLETYYSSVGSWYVGRFFQTWLVCEQEIRSGDSEEQLNEMNRIKEEVQKNTEQVETLLSKLMGIETSSSQFNAGSTHKGFSTKGSDQEQQVQVTQSKASDAPAAYQEALTEDMVIYSVSDIFEKEITQPHMNNIRSKMTTMENLLREQQAKIEALTKNQPAPTVTQGASMSSVPAAEARHSARQSGTMVIPKKETMAILVDRSSGQELGLDISKPSLEVLGIYSGGLIERHNQEKPSDEVMVGDRIVEVNGSTEKDQIRATCRENKILHITFEKGLDRKTAPLLTTKPAEAKAAQEAKPTGGFFSKLFGRSRSPSREPPVKASAAPPPVEPAKTPEPVLTKAATPKEEITEPTPQEEQQKLWSKDLSREVLEVREEEEDHAEVTAGKYPDVLILAGDQQVDSVETAVDKLNSGSIESPEAGYCLVYSQHQNSYWLLWQQNFKEEAYARFNLVMATQTISGSDKKEEDGTEQPPVRQAEGTSPSGPSAPMESDPTLARGPTSGSVDAGSPQHAEGLPAAFPDSGDTAPAAESPVADAPTGAPAPADEPAADAAAAPPADTTAADTAAADTPAPTDAAASAEEKSGAAADPSKDSGAGTGVLADPGAAPAAKAEPAAKKQAKGCCGGGPPPKD